MILMRMIDCDSCQAPSGSCDDCVVRSMMGSPQELNDDEQTALAVLVSAKMVPPLRWMPPDERQEVAGRRVA